MPHSMGPIMADLEIISVATEDLSKEISKPYMKDVLAKIGLYDIVADLARIATITETMAEDFSKYEDLYPLGTDDEDAGDDIELPEGGMD